MSPAARAEARSEVATDLLRPYFEQLQAFPAVRWEGRVTQVLGQVVESEGPVCAVGECCWLIDGNGRAQAGGMAGWGGWWMRAGRRWMGWVLVAEQISGNSTRRRLCLYSGPRFIPPSVA